jgi:hypothetical protein
MCFTIDILLWSFPVVQTASEGVNARIRKPGPWTETENLDHNGPFHLGPKQGKPARGEVNVTIIHGRKRKRFPAIVQDFEDLLGVPVHARIDSLRSR